MASSLFTFLKNKGFEWALALCIFSLPFQINMLVYESNWGRGFFNPYTSIFFSVFDVFLLGAAFLYIFFHTKKISYRWYVDPHFLVLLLLVTFSCFSFLWSPYTDIFFSFLLTVKLIELLLFFLLLQQTDQAQILLKSFVLSMSLQGIWAVFQVLFKQDLGLQFLGESHLSLGTAHIAHSRGYGSFPHPNILGGFLVTSILFTLHFLKTSRERKGILLSLQSLGLLATFSRTALLALALGLFSTYSFKKIFAHKITSILVGLILCSTTAFFFLIRSASFFTDPAILERLEGYKTALIMLKAHPWGLGFSHYTLFLDSISQGPLMPWEYQPVHNIFLLLLTEWGIPCFLIAGIIFMIFNHQLIRGFLFFLIILGLFDHYLISLEQGRLLLVLALGLYSLFTRANGPNKILAALR